MLRNILEVVFIFGSIFFTLPYAANAVRGNKLSWEQGLMVAFFLTGLIAVNFIF